MDNLLILNLLAVSLYATTTVDSRAISATATQATIPVATDQSGNCSYILSESPTLSPVIDDDNTTLFPGANSDGRSGSIGTGASHLFVAGFKMTQPDSSNRPQSRALAANTQYWGSVTCGADSPVLFNFSTRAMLMGSTYSEPTDWCSQAIGNYCVQFIDHTQPNKVYTDPKTGFKSVLVTHPGDMPFGIYTLCGSLSSCSGGTGLGGGGTTPAEILSATGWAGTGCAGNATDLYQAAGSSKYACYNSTVAQAPLIARMEGSGIAGTAFQFTLGNVLDTSSGWGSGVDAYQLTFAAFASVAQSVDVALTFNGVSRGTEWHTIALTTSSANYTYPANKGGLPYPAAGFASWQGSNFPLIPGNLVQVMEQHSNVNTSGTVVTMSNGTNGNMFPLDSRLFTAGSKVTIVISGSPTEYSVASVDSATQITLVTSAGTNSNVTLYWNNFGVLFRKTAIGSGSINVGNLQVKGYVSFSYGNGGAGFQNFCHHVQGTDSHGVTGRLCTFATTSNAAGIFWVTDPPIQSRFLGRLCAPPSAGSGQDDWNFACLSTNSLFDKTDPDTIYLVSSAKVSGGTVILKFKYNHAGAGGCSAPHDYQAFVPATYDSNSSIDNCQFEITNITPHSAGKELEQQLASFSGLPSPGGPASQKFSGIGLSFVQNGFAVLSIGHGQDSEGWVVLCRLSDGVVTGVFSSYMNTAKGSCRGCSTHAPVSGGRTDPWFSIAHNDVPESPGNPAYGSYMLPITTSITTAPSISKGACIVDASMTSLLANSDGCDIVHYTGSDHWPCRPNPSTWEAANMPGCTWTSGSIVPSGSIKWQAGAYQPGDWFWDNNTGGELMAIGFVGADGTGDGSSSTTLTIVRNLNPLSGPYLLQQPGITGSLSYLKNHTGTWYATVKCNFPTAAWAQTSEVDGSGQVWDATNKATGHLVQQPGGVVSREIFAFSQGAPGSSVRVGAFATVQNTPANNAVLNGAPFAGVYGVSCCAWNQAHPGWDSQYPYFLDMHVYAEGHNNLYMWNNNYVQSLSPPLYKVQKGTINCTSNGNDCSTGYVMDVRRMGTATWAGMNLFKDVSGTGTINNSSTYFNTWCTIRFSGDTCGQPNERVGDIFFNLPQANIDHCGFAVDANTPCFISMGMEPTSVQQYFFGHNSKYPSEQLSRFQRTLTRAHSRYGVQDGPSNAKPVFGSDNMIMYTATAVNLQRTGDIWAGVAPAETTDYVYRGDFARIPIGVSPGLQFAEIRFGYMESSPAATATSWYCTSAQDACNTSSPTTNGIVYSGKYINGISASGSAGQTCTLTGFNNGGSSATATVALNATNTLTNGADLVITAPGSGYITAPTQANVSSGTASCSGTATITTTVTPRPFNWSNEAKTLTTCTIGCTINIPALHNTVLYYSIWRSSNGSSWSQDVSVGYNGLNILTVY